MPVPDARLDALADIDASGAHRAGHRWSSWTSPAWCAGASQGEGLGNQFLANIRETDAICRGGALLRRSGRGARGRQAWTRPSDVETIKTELILADMATVEKAIPRLEKEAKRDKAGASRSWKRRSKALERPERGEAIAPRTLELDQDEQRRPSTICTCSR